MSAPEAPASRARGFPRLPARYAGLVMPLLLSIFMTAIVSLVSTLRSVGPVDGVVALWLGAWGMSWLIGFPTLLLVLPPVRRLTAWLVHPP